MDRSLSRTSFVSPVRFANQTIARPFHSRLPKRQAAVLYGSICKASARQPCDLGKACKNMMNRKNFVTDRELARYHGVQRSHNTSGWNRMRSRHSATLPKVQPAANKDAWRGSAAIWCAIPVLVAFGLFRGNKVMVEITSGSAQNDRAVLTTSPCPARFSISETNGRTHEPVDLLSSMGTNLGWGPVVGD